MGTIGPRLKSELSSEQCRDRWLRAAFAMVVSFSLFQGSMQYAEKPGKCSRASFSLNASFTFLMFLSVSESIVARAVAGGVQHKTALDG